MRTRRDFLKTSTLMGFSTTVPTFLSRTAAMAKPLGSPRQAETILVVLQLTGGNDGLNTVIPYTHPEYYKLRPTIGIKRNEVLKLTDSLGLHPAMEALAKLHEDSALCVVQGVGYPNPSQSHFRSMDIWHAASTAETLSEGWIGKALKQKALATFHLASGANETSPLALAGAPARVPSLTSLADFQLKMAAASGSDQAAQRQVMASATQPRLASPAENRLLDFVSRTAFNTYASSERLQQLGKTYTPKVPYPASSLATRLKLAAQLIEAGVGARIFYLSLDGFDTHAGQGGASGLHANLLRQLSEAVSAFYRDLAARGHAERVCLMTFSEFGRRGAENGSHGTDHGSGAPLLLVGGRVRPGIVGDHPDLTHLDRGNLPFRTDFRQVYAAILQDWLGLDAATIVGKDFSPAPIFRA